MLSQVDSPLAVIKSIVATLPGAAILDVGCGGGGLAGQLVSEGAIVTGIDPDADAVSQARALVPSAKFAQATAEALPFENGTFDAVVLVNSFHHVGLGAMDVALTEAIRVARPGSPLIVIEPLAAGSFFDALRMVEDETVLRLAAQEALVRAVANGLLKRSASFSYVRRETFEDVDAFLDRIVAVDPARRAVVRANYEAISAAVLAAAARTNDGKLMLDQPIKADILLGRGSQPITRS